MSEHEEDLSEDFRRRVYPESPSHPEGSPSRPGDVVEVVIETDEDFTSRAQTGETVRLEVDVGL
jgi:hypothetical protein